MHRAHDASPSSSANESLAVRSLGFSSQLNQSNEPDQKRGLERQKTRRPEDQNSFLDRGGLLMKAANGEVAFERTTAARSRGRSPRRCGTSSPPGDACGVRLLQRPVRQRALRRPPALESAYSHSNGWTAEL